MSAMACGGLENLKQLCQDLRDQPILVIVSQFEDQYTVRVLQVGDLVTADELVDAICKTIVDGRNAGDDKREIKLKFRRVQDKDSGSNAGGSAGMDVGAGASGATGKLVHELLSSRELQIVRMLGAGKSVGHIAADLSLSVKTVSTYRTRALEKMNLSTNADLIRYVIEHKLAPLAPEGN